MHIKLIIKTSAAYVHASEQLQLRFYVLIRSFAVHNYSPRYISLVVDIYWATDAHSRSP